MPAATYKLVSTAQPAVYIETVAGDMPTTGVSIGAHYYDQQGAEWVYDGTQWISVSSPALTSISTGELAGATSATQLPNVPCNLIKLKARSDNAGSVYLGGSGVTLPNGTTDTTTGLQLAPGDETGWLPISNANLLYRICDNAGDDLTYLALS